LDHVQNGYRKTGNISISRTKTGGPSALSRPGCSLCAAACPADAIFVEASENTDEKRFSPGERYASTYEINMLRCIYCGYCEDACPTEAIVLGDNYELSFYDRRSAIYTKEMLLEPVPTQSMTTPQKVEPGKFDRRSVPEMKDPHD
jgi:NADH-quinone oxidoreductase subunit I